ncbi:hypothetical protein F5146DRAFT_1143564 [Armillaria mellea]|nr:hypothetical protein F5146DRAFT_1143564 [Armillaria mellea]
MSARLHLSRNTKPTVVELPPEVWALIFDWTTHVPEAYDPDYLPQSFTNPPSKAQNLDRIKSFRSRSSLVRVCKAWSVIALKNIFEHIVITKDTHIPSLYNALLRPRDDAESGSTGPHPGFYTRCLDISLKTSDVNKAITDLGDIIRWFPNLSFITISLGLVDRPQRRFCYYGRDGVLAALAGPLLDALCFTCTSLEVIEVLYRSSFFISNSDLRRVLSSFPKLRSLRNEGNMQHILDPRIHVPCFHLATSLTTVALDDRESKSIPLIPIS